MSPPSIDRDGLFGADFSAGEPAPHPPLEIRRPLASLDHETRDRVDSLRCEGRRAAPALREHFERHYGSLPGGVRIHTGREETALLEDLGAVGFTIGRDVFLSREGESRPEVIVHELMHTLDDDPTTLQFWAGNELATTTTEIVRRLTGERMPTVAQLRSCIRPLLASGRTRADLEQFFRGYRAEGTPPATPQAEEQGAVRFLNDLAECLRGMAADESVDLSSLHAFPDRSRGNRDYFENDVIRRIRIIHPGFVYAQQVRAAAERIEARDAAADSSRAEQELIWRQYWSEAFSHGGFEHPVFPSIREPGQQAAGRNGGTARLGLWILSRWDQFIQRASPLGAAAAAIQVSQPPRWVAERNDTWSRSLWVLRHDDRERQVGRENGLTWFGGIYSGYANSFAQMCLDAQGLEAHFRGHSRDVTPYTRLPQNLTRWGQRGTGARSEPLSNSLTPPNQRRLAAIGQCWTRDWRLRRMAGDSALLLQAGIEIGGAMGGIHLRPWDTEAR